MATVVLASVADVWPSGTTVGAYLQSNQPTGWDRASTPTGSTSATAAVQASGSLTFTGLADDTAYVAAAQVSSVWKVRSFRTAAASAVTVDQTARDSAAAASTAAGTAQTTADGAATTATAAIAKSLVDAKGDLLVGTADNTIARLAVGANGTLPYADSTQTGGVAWAAKSHQRLPSQNGLLAWTGNPELGNNGNNATLGRTHWVKCFCEEAITFTTIWWHILAAGSAGTPLNFILGAAAQNGTLLGRTTDQATAGMSTTGEKSATLTAEGGQTLTHPGGVGTYFFLGFVVGTAHTTPATFTRLSVSSTLPNFGLGTAAGVKRSGYSTASGATTLATFTPSTMLQDHAWVLAVS